MSADFLIGRTESREGIEALNKMIDDDMTVGEMLSKILSCGDKIHKLSFMLYFKIVQKIHCELTELEINMDIMLSKRFQAKSRFLNNAVFSGGHGHLMLPCIIIGRTAAK